MTTFAEAWHARTSANLAKMDAAISKLGELFDRDRRMSQEYMSAVTDVADGVNATLTEFKEDAAGRRKQISKRAVPSNLKTFVEFAEYVDELFPE